jgi:general secretion pathway protein K
MLYYRESTQGTGIHTGSISPDPVQCMEVLNNERGGVALVIVIWIIVVLIAIVGEFSSSMRTETNIARNFKEEEEAYQLALAGIEQAKLELLTARPNAVVYLDEDNMLVFGNEDEDRKKLERKDDMGKGSFKYVISDEDGKLNINTESVERLKYIFIETGIDITEVDTIVDSIADWRDTDDLHMLNGAEEDYYRSLDRPYSCKDGPLDSLEELLLVKGMKKEYLSGSKKKEEAAEEEKVYEGAEKYFTVYGTTGVNINTASRAVLEAVFGPDAATNIMTQRDAGPVSSPMPNGKVSSEIFTIISTGTVAEGSIKRSVKTVVHRKDRELETLYWNDNIIG